jgi:hypothetical protein
MAGVTNRGKFLMLQLWGRTTSPVTSVFYLALSTSTTAPNPDTNTVADISEIAAGNGYTSGGLSVSRNSTDFDVLTEDDTNDRGLIQLKDFVWTASGGNLPASGLGARYALGLTDEGTISARQVWAFWDLVSDRTVSVGQTLTLQNCEVRLTE